MTAQTGTTEQNNSAAHCGRPLCSLQSPVIRGVLSYVPTPLQRDENEPDTPGEFRQTFVLIIGAEGRHKVPEFQKEALQRRQGFGTFRELRHIRKSLKRVIRYFLH